MGWLHALCTCQQLHGALTGTSILSWTHLHHLLELRHVASLQHLQNDTRAVKKPELQFTGAHGREQMTSGVQALEGTVFYLHTLPVVHLGTRGMPLQDPCAPDVFCL